MHDDSIGLADEPVNKNSWHAARFAVAGMIFDVVNGDYDRDVPYKRGQQIQPDVVLAEKMDNVRPPRLNAGEQLGDQDEIGRRSMARPVKRCDLDPRVYEGSTGDAFFWGAEQDLAGLCQQLGIFDAIVERSRSDQGDPHVVFLRRRPNGESAPISLQLELVVGQQKSDETAIQNFVFNRQPQR